MTAIKLGLVGVTAFFVATYVGNNFIAVDKATNTNRSDAVIYGGEAAVAAGVAILLGKLLGV